MRPTPAFGFRPSRRAALLSLASTLGVLSGCESFRQGTAAPEAGPGSPPVAIKRPTQHHLRVGPYVFYAADALNPADPLFKELEELPECIQAELELPPGESLVQVFLFPNKEHYEAYMGSRYPRLPIRRAYFIAEPRTSGGGDDLLVFTWLGDNLKTDLRHELTHATLHGVLKGVPLWLDEGLAGFFELPPGQDGLNPQHLEASVRGPFQPDLPRLEKLVQVRQMEKAEYREAWAWVHLMLRGTPQTRQALVEYIAKLKTEAEPGPLQPRLSAAVGDVNTALADHLAKTSLVARGRR
jgi:hypothetical protein